MSRSRRKSLFSPNSELVEVAAETDEALHGQYPGSERDMGYQSGNHGMDRHPQGTVTTLVPSLQTGGQRLDESRPMHTYPKRKAGSGDTNPCRMANAPRIDDRAVFTGKRRPKLTAKCPCCEQTFTTTFENQIYLNEAHKKRHYRAMKKEQTSRHV